MLAPTRGGYVSNHSSSCSSEAASRSGIVVNHARASARAWARGCRSGERIIFSK